MKTQIAACCIVLMMTVFGELKAQTIVTNCIDMEQSVLLDDTRIDLIKKCLNHLAESIVDGDKEKVYNLKEYALTLEDSTYLPLLPRELWLIDLYLYSFDDFLNDVVALDSAREASISDKIIFRSDLYRIVLQKVIENLDNIKQTAHNEPRLTETDKDFIDVFAKQMETEPSNRINIMNKESNNFLKNHPNSEYDYFVKRNLTYKFEKDFDGMSLDVSIGPGLCILSGEITDWFERCKGAFQCDIALGVLRYELSWNFVGMFDNTAKQDITFPNGSVWEEGKSWSALTHQFCIGRYFPLNHNLVFIPRVGVGYSEFLAPYDHDDKENPLNNQKLKSVMPCFGAEIKYEKVFQDNAQTAYFGPVLRLSVQPIRTEIEGNVTYGAITTLSAVFKIGMCGSKRVY